MFTKKHEKQRLQEELALLDRFLKRILTLLNLPQPQDPVDKARKDFFADQKTAIVSYKQILDTQSQLLTLTTDTARQASKKQLFSTYKVTKKSGKTDKREALLLGKIAAAANLSDLLLFFSLCQAEKISERINQTASQGKTPLHLAAESKKETSLAVCMLLLCKKADPTLAGSDKTTPYAYVTGNRQLTLLFKQNQATPPGSYQIKEEDVDPDKLYAGIEKDVSEQGFKFK